MESSAFAIKLLNKFGELGNILDEQIDEAVSFFMDCLDLEDGFFKDPLVSEDDKVSERHSWEHIWAHMSGATTSVLNLMGKTDLPKKESPPFADLRIVNPEEWLLSLPWEDPWMEGEHLTRVVKWYWNQLPEEKRRPDEPKINELLDAFEKHIIDQETGMPTRGGCTSRNKAMAGAFKAFGSYRLKDIQDAGNRIAEFLLKVHRKSDGGFSFYPDHCLQVHNSVRISDKKPESDSLGILMGVQCMEYADEWNAMR